MGRVKAIKFDAANIEGPIQIRRINAKHGRAILKFLSDVYDVIYGANPTAISKDLDGNFYSVFRESYEPSAKIHTQSKPFKNIPIVELPEKYWPTFNELSEVAQTEEETFEFGEMIEVWDKEGGKKYRRIFLAKVPRPDAPFMCVHEDAEQDFKMGVIGGSYMFWEFAGKIIEKPHLTQAQIAEKFGLEIGSFTVEPSSDAN